MCILWTLPLLLSARYAYGCVVGGAGCYIDGLNDSSMCGGWQCDVGQLYIYIL